MSDRDVLTKAINSSPNLSVAARRLDVSRRTLQNRMRSAGLPRGQAGRPRRSLSYHGESSGAAGLIAAVAIVGAGVFLYKRYGGKQLSKYGGGTES